VSGSPPAVWPPFLRAALALALTGGFGLGGALFAALTLRLPLALWWPAAAQAHGHLQLFGWAGLLVLGVGFHFLPRLRGAPLARPERAGVVLRLLLAGLTLRALVQPALAAAGPGPPAPALRAGLACSGVLELAGATLALGMLARTLRQGRPLRERDGLRQILPFLLAAFAAFWLALGLNLVGVTAAALSGAPLVAAPLDRATIHLALYGFLLPVAVAMSARLFPLYFRTPLPRLGPLRLGLGCVLAGLAARLAGEVGDAPLLGGVGRLAQALALGLFTLALGVFAPHRPLPRQPVRPLADPVQWHALSAYLWLVVGAATLAWTGGVAIGGAASALPGDAEVHALGAGFITILILGVGAHLLPGFTRRPLRSRALVWSTLVLGNVAALLRVGPLLLPALFPAPFAGIALTLSGLGGLAAIGVFGVNLTGLPRSRPAAC
jgi:uncharacterized protein involved in response to NO